MIGMVTMDFFSPSFVLIDWIKVFLDDGVDLSL